MACATPTVPATPPHATKKEKQRAITRCFNKKKLVDEAGFEPATFGFGGQHSIQLSYPSVWLCACTVFGIL